MSTKLHVLALAAGLLLPATAIAATPESEAGYFGSAGAALLGPTEYNTGSASTTLQRQQASGYFATADAPLVAPPTVGDGSQTLAKQRASGYFPSADTPLVAPTVTTH